MSKNREPNSNETTPEIEAKKPQGGVMESMRRKARKALLPAVAATGMSLAVANTAEGGIKETAKELGEWTLEAGKELGGDILDASAAKAFEMLSAEDKELFLEFVRLHNLMPEARLIKQKLQEISGEYPFLGPGAWNQLVIISLMWSIMIGGATFLKRKGAWQTNERTRFSERGRHYLTYALLAASATGVGAYSRQAFITEDMYSSEVADQVRAFREQTDKNPIRVANEFASHTDTPIDMDHISEADKADLAKIMGMFIEKKAGQVMQDLILKAKEDEKFKDVGEALDAGVKAGKSLKELKEMTGMSEDDLAAYYAEQLTGEPPNLSVMIPRGLAILLPLIILASNRRWWMDLPRVRQMGTGKFVGYVAGFHEPVWAIPQMPNMQVNAASGQSTVAVPGSPTNQPMSPAQANLIAYHQQQAAQAGQAATQPAQAPTQANAQQAPQQPVQAVAAPAPDAPRRPRDYKLCTQCRKRNPKGSSVCGRCGGSLTSKGSSNLLH